MDTTIEKAKRALLTMQRLSWEQGMAIRAFWELGDEETAVLLAKEAVHRQLEDGRMAISADVNISADPGSCGIPCLLIAEKTGDDEMKAALDKMLYYYQHTAQRTNCGVLTHFMEPASPPRRRVLIDAVYHLIPFLTAMGQVEEAMAQYHGFKRLLFNEETKLYHHKYDDASQTIVRKDYWGGGNGWAACAFVWMYEYLPSDRQTEKAELAQHAKEVIDAMLSYQRDDGLFHDIVDDPNSFVETTGGLMLAFAIFESVRLGILDQSYFAIAAHILTASEAKIDAFGIVQDADNPPNFVTCGYSVEGQAFYLLCVAAKNRLLN
ncbi:MAG: glycoside hydrolase family 88 protein [Faecalibacterium sp.]